MDTIDEAAQDGFTLEERTWKLFGFLDHLSRGIPAWQRDAVCIGVSRGRVLL